MIIFGVWAAGKQSAISQTFVCVQIYGNITTKLKSLHAHQLSNGEIKCLSSQIIFIQCYAYVSLLGH